MVADVMNCVLRMVGEEKDGMIQNVTTKRFLCVVTQVCYLQELEFSYHFDMYSEILDNYVK